MFGAVELLAPSPTVELLAPSPISSGGPRCAIARLKSSSVQPRATGIPSPVKERIAVPASFFLSYPLSRSAYMMCRSPACARWTGILKRRILLRSSAKHSSVSLSQASRSSVGDAHRTSPTSLSSLFLPRSTKSSDVNPVSLTFST
eukprot:3132029-Prymnesium_polylepis.2